MSRPPPLTGDRYLVHRVGTAATTTVVAVEGTRSSPQRRTHEEATDERHRAEEHIAEHVEAGDITQEQADQRLAYPPRLGAVPVRARTSCSTACATV